MYDIVADSDGGVTITVAAGTITSEFGLIGALVIQGYTPTSNSGPLPSFTVQQQRVEEVLTNVSVTQEVKVYPNPFSQSFTLAVPAENNEQVDVSIYDLGGRQVYQNRFGNLNKGVNYLQVRTPASLKPGVYMVQTTFAGKKEFKLVKVIKQ